MRFGSHLPDSLGGHEFDAAFEWRFSGTGAQISSHAAKVVRQAEAQTWANLLRCATQRLRRTAIRLLVHEAGGERATSEHRAAASARLLKTGLACWRQGSRRTSESRLKTLEQSANRGTSARAYDQDPTAAAFLPCDRAS